MSQDQVRSTTHRLGRTSKPVRWILFTTSTATWRSRQCWTKVRLNPESHHTLARRLERARARSATAMPPVLSEGVSGDDDHGEQQSEGVHDPEGLAALDLLAGVEALGFVGHRRRRADAASIDDPRRGLPVTALALAHRLGQTSRDPLPGSVARPPQVEAVHGVPARIAVRQRPPLTARRRDVEDRVHDPAPVHAARPTHVTGPPPGPRQIRYQLPLFIGHVPVRRSPCRSLGCQIVARRLHVMPSRHPRHGNLGWYQHILCEQSLRRTLTRPRSYKLIECQ